MSSGDFWLHGAHGGVDGGPATQLQVPIVTPGGSIAGDCATALNASGAGGPIKGLACRIVGVHLHIEQGLGAGVSEPLRVPLFLADVSCAELKPGLLVVAVVPRMPGGSLQSALAENAASVSSSDRTSPTLVWLVLRQYSADEEGFYGLDPAEIVNRTQAHILDACSLAGSLRRDLRTVYEPQGHGVIGEGAYASVYLMREVRSDHQVAVKRMNVGVDLDAIEREVELLFETQLHSNIVAIRGLFWTFGEDNVPIVSVVFDLAPFGDLLRKVLKLGILTEEASRPLVGDILSGLAHIHAQDIIHRDIKVENILLKSRDSAVISDFGLATRVTDKKQMGRRCGSPGYVAPEICLGVPYDSKIDTFGMGVVLYFILSKEMPFSSPDRDTATTMRRTVKCSLHLHRPPWDQKTSKLRGVLRLLICKDPNERGSALVALNHAWFNQAHGAFGPQVGLASI